MNTKWWFICSPQTTPSFPESNQNRSLTFYYPLIPARLFNEIRILERVSARKWRVADRRIGAAGDTRFAEIQRTPRNRQIGRQNKGVIEEASLRITRLRFGAEAKAIHETRTSLGPQKFNMEVSPFNFRIIL